MNSQFDSILDISGVEGAAFIGTSGAIIDRNMPAIYSD